jgi:anaerobic selenocysteine-containing dehydrogenase
MAETQTVLWSRVLDRIAGPDRPKIVWVDPRDTEVARYADVHLALKPGTNLALMDALVREVLQNGWEDSAYLSDHTLGLEDLRKTVEPWTPGGRGGNLRCGGGGHPGGGKNLRNLGPGAVHRVAGVLPVLAGHGLRLPGQQPAPAARHAGTSRLRVTAKRNIKLRLLPAGPSCAAPSTPAPRGAGPGIPSPLRQRGVPSTTSTRALRRTGPNR